jgi:hypothetical protein
MMIGAIMTSFVFLRAAQVFAKALSEASMMLFCLDMCIDSSESANVNLPFVSMTKMDNLYAWRCCYGVLEKQALQCFKQFEPCFLVLLWFDVVGICTILVEYFGNQKPILELWQFAIGVALATGPSFGALLQCVSINEVLSRLHINLQKRSQLSSVSHLFSGDVNDDVRDTCEAMSLIATSMAQHGSKLKIFGFEITVTTILIMRSYLGAAAASVIYPLVAG